MGRKQLLAAAAALAALTIANSASATIYTYTDSIGDTLTINTTAGTGSLIGPDRNETFTGNFSSFTGGTSPMLAEVPISMTTTSYVLSGNQTGTDTVYNPQPGVVYNAQTPAQGGHQAEIMISGTSIFVWADWYSPQNGVTLSDNTTTITGCGADTLGGTEGSNCADNPGTSTSTSGGTTTGGTTTGGTTTGGTTTGGTTTGGTTTGGTTTGGTTSGGTSVPEPANELALFGLGVAAIFIGRRDIMRRKAKA